MKTISIFLASSIEEFKFERLELGDFIRQLNDIYSPELYFRLHLCEDESDAMSALRKQEEYNRMIRESQLFFVIFYTKVGQYTVEEFNVALEEFRKKNSPKIVTYFKALKEGENPTEDIKRFMKRLDEELGHYYNLFSSLDTVKLSMVLEVARDKSLGLNLELKDSVLSSNGKNLLSFNKIPLYCNNKALQALKERKAQLEDNFALLSAKASSDEGAKNQLRDVIGELNQVDDDIHKIEMSILDLSSNIVEFTTFGKPVTTRIKEALRCFEKGDYEGVKAILDSKERELQAERDEELSDKLIERHIAYIEENMLLIKALKAEGVNKDSAQKIIELYEKAVAKAEKFGLNKKCMFDFALFLCDQNKISEAIKVNERLRAHFDLEGRAADNSLRLALLNNLANLYRLSNRHKEAEGILLQTLELRRQLAKANPDTHEPSIAIICNNLGLIYADLNCHEEAENYYLESLKIRRPLAKKNPKKYEPSLANSCIDLANLYKKQNRYEDAQSFYSEALEIYRSLAKNNSEFESRVALVCNNLGLINANLNRLNVAEKFYLESLEIRSRFAKKNPDKFELSLASTCNNLANLYRQTNRPNDAETLYLESLEIRRRLANANPSAFEPDFAKTCYCLAILYRNLNRTDESEKLYLEALKIRRKFAKLNPDAFSSSVASTCNSLANLYKNLERYDDAEALYLEAISLYRRLAEKNPDAFTYEVGVDCRNLAILYRITGRSNEAEPLFIESLEIYRSLAKINPQTYQPDVASACNSLAILYKNTGRLDDAEKLFLEALEIRSRFAEANFDKFGSDVADVYYNLGLLSKKRNNLAQAETYYNDALEIYRSLAKTNPKVYEPNAADACESLAIVYKNLNQPEKANKFSAEALEIATKYKEVNKLCQNIFNRLNK